MKIIVTGFFDTMSRGQRLAGLIYLPIHAVVLPLVLSFIPGVDELTLNIIYYAISFLFCMTVFWKYLRGAFDILLDNKLNCFITLLMGYSVYFVLSLVIGGILAAILGTAIANNPNNDAISRLSSTTETNALMGLAVFIGPIVEETLFRGALFGSIRPKHRVIAYVVTVVLFALYHVWQYAVVFGDARMLIYGLQYVPVGIGLCLAYEKSNCIWVPIFMHMLINLVAMLALT